MLHFYAVPAPPFTGETDSHTSLAYTGGATGPRSEMETTSRQLDC